MIHPKLELIFSWLPDRCPKVFIAGGAAVDFELASDVDLWFPAESRGEALRFMHRFPARSLVDSAMTPKPSSEDFQAQKMALLKAYETKAKQKKVINNAIDIAEVGSSNYSSVVSGTSVLGWVWHPDIAKPIQVILHDSAGPIELIRNFDITSHAKAVTAFGKVIETSWYTLPTEPPRIVNYVDANKTILRYFRICSRYGHQVDLNHIGEVTGKWWLKDYAGNLKSLLELVPPASKFGHLNENSGGQESGQQESAAIPPSSYQWKGTEVPFIPSITTKYMSSDGMQAAPKNAYSIEYVKKVLDKFKADYPNFGDAAAPIGDTEKENPF